MPLAGKTGSFNNPPSNNYYMVETTVGAKSRKSGPWQAALKEVGRTVGPFLGLGAQAAVMRRRAMGEATPRSRIPKSMAMPPLAKATLNRAKALERIRLLERNARLKRARREEARRTGRTGATRSRAR